MIYPLVRELAADGIPVAVTCRVLKIARQPYYRWLAAPVTDAELAAAYRANAIFDAHRDDPEFGYRFLAEEARDAGQVMAERTAWRICSDNGWWSSFGKRRRGKKTRIGAPAHDDLVRRQFTAPGPNQVWLSDLTEHPTAEGSSTSARSRTSGPGGSSATRSATEWNQRSLLPLSTRPSPAAPWPASPPPAASCIPTAAVNSRRGSCSKP